MGELRRAFRSLRGTPGLTVMAITALALGIGANTAIFSVIRSVMLKPLPYSEPQRLMTLWDVHPEEGRDPGSWPNFVDWRAGNTAFASMGAAGGANLNLTGLDEPERLLGARVTHDFFTTLGVEPLRGRYILAEEDRPGARRVVVLSEGFWTRRFGSDPSIVGREIRINGEQHVVTGIMPRSFALPSPLTEAWVPLALDPADTNGRRSDFLRVFARLKAGVTVDQAQANITALTEGLARKYPGANARWTTIVRPLHEEIVGGTRTALLVLYGAVGFVLLIACANAASLQLARAAARQRDIAIRLALGAGRGRLLKQLLTESVLIAGCGCVAGVLIAQWMIDLLLASGPRDIPRLAETRIDGTVLLFTAAVALATGPVFGLFPALAALRTDVNESLKGSGRGSAGSLSGTRFRRLLVAGEMALSLVLLLGAGLLIRTLHNLRSADPGFSGNDVSTASLALSPGRCRERASCAAYVGQILERLSSTAGVESVGAAGGLPLSGVGNNLSFGIQGQAPLPDGQAQSADYMTADAGYFQTLRIPLVRGRLFSAVDGPDAPRVALISESMARRYWPDKDPIGYRITIDGQNFMEIVGIIGNVQYQDWMLGTKPLMIAHVLQTPQRSLHLVSRGSGGHSSLAATLRRETRAVEPDQPVHNVRPFSDVINTAFARPRFQTLLLTFFAVLALVLACAGVYGLISHLVGQRTREIGLRMALGATQGSVVRLMLSYGLRLAVIGAILGAAGSIALTSFMQKLLFRVTPFDPLTFAASAAVLLAIAAIACWIPARRAARVEPTVALRCE